MPARLHPLSLFLSNHGLFSSVPSFSLPRSCSPIAQFPFLTWEDEDEAGCEAADERDDTPNVRDGESEDECGTEPDKRVQHTPSSLSHHVCVHVCAVKTQPQTV